MASENVLELTTDNFQAQVLGSDKPVLVDFWAEWCMPCKVLAPTIDELADEFKDRVGVGKVDTDSNPDLGVQFGISAIPTVIIFKGGEPLRKFVGVTNKNDLQTALEEALAGAVG